MAKKEPFSKKLHGEREGADNTLRTSRKAGEKSNNAPNKKKAQQRRTIKRESDAAKARSKKLRIEQTAGEATARNAQTTVRNGKEIVNPKRPGNVFTNTASARGHQIINQQNEDHNVGVDATHFSEEVAEGSVKTAQYAKYSHKLKQYKKLEKLEHRADKEAVESILKEQMEADPSVGSNLFSKWRQRQAIKKEYAAAKAGRSGAGATAEGAKKATKEAGKLTEKAVEFVKSHSHIIVMIAAIGLLVMVLSGFLSSCSAMLSGTGNVVLGTSFTAEDADILGADQDYTALENALRRQIDNIESTHSGYDEYRYNLAEIGHNPYELAALLTVEYEDYTRSEVQSRLQSIFDAQYTLTLEEEVEIRTRTETRTSTYTDPETGEETEEEYEVEVEYEYYILNVTLTNKGVSMVARSSGLSDDQMERYDVLLETRGNRDDLFGDVSFSVPGGEYTDYDIPGEALMDEKFRRMITEAEKYLGYPYVWGGSSPSTSFDCSGFVCWVLNHSGNGWNVGRTTAEGLRQMCAIIPRSEAKPGDLIFFQGTYDTAGASHIGIYVGNGMMIHCGNPISYASIETSYWQQHFYCFGRMR